VRGSTLRNLTVDLVTVTRPHKLIPFLLIFLNAHLLSASQANWWNFVPAFLFIVASCSIGMRINTWTDRDLDQSTKPELYHHLSRSFRFHVVGMMMEGALSLACLVFLIRSRELSEAIWLLSFGVLFTLYSFNFLVPRRGKEYRFKVYWWGNLAAAGGGYFALWMAGLSSGAGRLSLETCLSLAFFYASLEYAVFLGECATDAEAERANGLQTLPARLGRFGTVLVAWVYCLLLTLAWFGSGPARFGEVFGNWYTISSITACSGFLFMARKPHSPPLWDRFSDLSFWIIRLGALATILFWHGA